ncbi:brix domain containing protein [Diaporthe amygdali]|uniref:brix domain containing protein n=1 Tax=Phomopsis amygdali TaxID=1214568 RepID=UPI0022FE008C|nr:brix domain containing protein [Diaporthe amygdali]KAJ0116301.1 brix domain containing protein [Diaporthe amygdali]
MAGSKLSANKIHRQERHVQDKRTSSKAKREERMRRRKEEAKDPERKQERLSRNLTRTLDQKRKWDEADEENLYSNADVAAMKRRKLEEEQNAAADEPLEDENDEEEDDVDSMLGSDDDEEADEDAVKERIEKMRAKRAERQPSAAPSTTSTNFDMTPAVLSAKFPNLFSDEPPKPPKVLVTTSINSTLHKEAEILTSLFPNSEYIRRSAHRYGHKYSVREICKYASNREYTAVLVLNEDQKKPNRLTIVHLPQGPTLTYSVNNWIEGSKLPGHGKAQDAYYPELLLNNFKSSLGLLAAKSFQTLFPPQPDIEMRQVVTLHNQRDYIFLRRHRYIFRDRRETEKSVQAADGKELHGVEGIRVGLQELGPRCTLKLRRVDKGIGRAGSEGEDALSWEWKAKMEKVRTRFNL